MSGKTRIRGWMARIEAIWKKESQRAEAILPKTVADNVSRFKIMVMIAVPVIALTIFWMWFAPVETPMEILWRKYVLIFDAVFLVSMILLYFIVAFFAKRPRMKVFLALQFVACLLLLGESIVITTVGQLISPNISVLIYGIVILSAVFLIRPITVILLFTLSYLGFYFALGWTQTDPTLLFSNRLNGLILMFMGIFLSFVFWEYYVHRQEQIEVIASQAKDLEEKNQELFQLATRDPLSGLINRRQAETNLHIFRNPGPLPQKPSENSLLILDIDDLKRINDTQGHPAGDETIRGLAKILLECSEPTDIVSRWGGDEFLMAKLGSSLAKGLETGRKIRDRIAATRFVFENWEIALTISIGIAPMRNSLEEAYRDADMALYEAKKSGKNTVRVFREIPEQ